MCPVMIAPMAAMNGNAIHDATPQTALTMANVLVRLPEYEAARAEYEPADAA
jgi:hypothetical protein